MSGAIDQVAERLAEEWNLQLGPRMTGGTVAFVYEATADDGRPCVLKVLPSLREGQGDFGAERDILRAAAGRGYVELLRVDNDQQAMLLERLGAQMFEDGRSSEQWVDSLARLLVETWEIELDPMPTLMTAADKCEWFVDFLDRMWRELAEPCSRRIIDEAIRFAERRGAAFDPSTAVVCHGDAHAWNALQVPGTDRYKFIDPDPFVAEPAADLAVPMREWSGDLLIGGEPLRATQQRCARIVGITGCDPQAVWEWGFIERVSTALIGLTEPEKVGSMADWFVVSEGCVGAGPA